MRSFIWSYAHVAIFAGLAIISVGITLAIQQEGGLSVASLTLGLGCALTLLVVTFVHQIGPVPLRRGELTARLSITVLLVLLAFARGWLDSALVTILIALALILVTLIEFLSLVRKRATPS